MTEFIRKDSAQKIIFIPYINANIEFGNKLKKVIELLKAENGKWKIEDEIAELYDKLLEVVW